MSVLFLETKRKCYLRFCTAAKRDIFWIYTTQIYYSDTQRRYAYYHVWVCAVCLRVSLSMKRRRPFKLTLTHAFKYEHQNAMPDNEIENISNECQKSEASEKLCMLEKETWMVNKKILWHASKVETNLPSVRQRHWGCSSV